MPSHGSRPGHPAPAGAPRHGLGADAEPVTQPLDLRGVGADPVTPTGRPGYDRRDGDGSDPPDHGEVHAPDHPPDHGEDRGSDHGEHRGHEHGAARHPRRRRRGSPPASGDESGGPGGGPVPQAGQGQRHGHGHGHGYAPPAGRGVRLLLAALLVPCALAALVGLVLLRPTAGPPPTADGAGQQPVRGEVVAVAAADCASGDGQAACTELRVNLTDGPRAGRDLLQIVPREPGTPRFAVGDRVVLGWSGGDPDDAASYQVVDFQRGGALTWLAALFVAAVLLLGRWRGLASLAALGVAFGVLLLFVLPAILSGRNPLAVAVVGAGVIMFAVLYLTHGLSARTSTAVVGTLVSLALIGALGAGFSAAARLTGLDDQTNALIASLGTGVDARGLLLAGMVIGALGVLDDVTVTQTSAVWELRAANPRLGAARLFRAATRIGRDHVASAVNTLVLAYAGAALPLLLVFQLSGRSLGEVVTSQDVAMEVVRTLVGSIGLVASVPVTTAVAALVASREEPSPDRPAPGRAASPRRRPRGPGARRGRGTRTAARPAVPGTGPDPDPPATTR